MHKQRPNHQQQQQQQQHQQQDQLLLHDQQELRHGHEHRRQHKRKFSLQQGIVTLLVVFCLTPRVSCSHPVWVSTAAPTTVTILFLAFATVDTATIANTVSTSPEEVSLENTIEDSIYQQDGHQLASPALSPDDQQRPQSVHLRRKLSSTNSKENIAGGVDVRSHTKLFQHSRDVEILGPTGFPKPTDLVQVPGADQVLQDETEELVPFLKPVIGKHRPHMDAVFAFAAEYELRRYVLFVETLRKTGFQGDIVLSVSEIDLQDADVRAYLSSDPGIIVYAPRFTCFNFEREEVESMKGGIRLCQSHELWAKQKKNTATENQLPFTAIKDPRIPRTVATTRYEIYWIMAINYNPDVWFLLVDSRDTVFQSNPFEFVPRNTDSTKKSGLLYYFGENVEATRLGQSKANAKWISTAYGTYVADALANKPTVCSGATMGEQVALEAYMRAMVAESDETQTVLMGADQGFHNFLYYSHKLSNCKQIHGIMVFDQGSGIVNNMGAMRTKPLEEWGNGKTIREIQDKEKGLTRYVVLNWDGTPSPVVHQYDRHKELGNYFFFKLGRELGWEVEPRIKEQRKKNEAAAATS